MTSTTAAARTLRALSHELLDGWIAEDGSKATTDELVGREVPLIAACEAALTGTPVDPADYTDAEHALMESDEASRMITACEDLDPGATDDEIVAALSAPLLALAWAMRADPVGDNMPDERLIIDQCLELQRQPLQYGMQRIDDLLAAGIRPLDLDEMAGRTITLGHVDDAVLDDLADITHIQRIDPMTEDEIDAAVLQIGVDAMGPLVVNPDIERLLGETR